MTRGGKPSKHETYHKQTPNTEQTYTLYAHDIHKSHTHTIHTLNIYTQHTYYTHNIQRYTHNENIIRTHYIDTTYRAYS